MGKSVLYILQDNGAHWVKSSTDFTKRITSDEVQVFLSLSPSGNKLAIFCEMPFWDYNIMINIPPDYEFPYDLSHDEIVAILQKKHPALCANDVFVVWNKNRKNVIVAVLPYSKIFAVYGTDGKMHYSSSQIVDV